MSSAPRTTIGIAANPVNGRESPVCVATTWLGASATSGVPPASLAPWSDGSASVVLVVGLVGAVSVSPAPPTAPSVVVPGAGVPGEPAGGVGVLGGVPYWALTAVV